MKRWETIIKRLDPDRPIVGAEIGVFKGKNSKQLLEALPYLELHMIDRWMEYTDAEKSKGAGVFISHFLPRQWKNIQRIAQRKVAEYGDRAKIVRMESTRAAEIYPKGFFDFVFIDGDHSYVGCKRDIKLWLPKVKQGGYLCGHDYTREGVKKAVSRFFPESRVELDDDNTWFVRV